MTRRIALIHVHLIAMQPVEDAFRRQWPEAHRANILDEPLFYERGKSDTLQQPLFDRIVQHGHYARDTGAEAILYTCSAFGAAIEHVQETFRIPVLKPNEAMYEAALESGRRIGLLATAGFAVPGLEQELRDLAMRRGRTIELVTKIVPEAQQALIKGDADTHNRLLADAAPALADTDVVMLAHFSTSRAHDAVAARIKVPLLTAPGAAVDKMWRLLS